jgi:methylated-DNA-[protein]-cysteine S-methyltransferase
MNAIIFATPFGDAAVMYKPGPAVGQVRRITLPTPEPQVLQAEMARFSPLLTDQHPDRIVDLVRRIQAYLSGEPAALPLEPLDFSACSPFQQKVLRLLYTIPYGEVRTYQWLADRLGTPHAARAVGNALARNPFPLVMPCHRCIRSDGTLGGFQRPGLKAQLLALEGYTG